MTSQKEENTTEKECPYKDRCPYLNFEPAAKVLRERNLLRQKIEEMEKTMNLAAEKITRLNEENTKLKEENKRLVEKIKEINQQPFKKKQSRNNEEEKIGEGEVVQVRKGAPPGHLGATRKKPERIDEYRDVYPEKCPLCGSTDLHPCVEKEEKLETHIQEDLVIQKRVTCFRHHHAYCPHCKKVVSANGENELPRAYIGPMARAMAGYLHYQAKVSKGGVVKTFEEFFGLEITAATLVGFDSNLCKKGIPLYEQIKERVQWSNSIHVDETGWKLDGLPYWLWCFANTQIVLYHIDEKRSSVVVKKTLGEKYTGILISDDFSAYGPVEARAKQKCTVHFLRDIREALEEPLDEDSKKFLIEIKILIKKAVFARKEYLDGKKSKEELIELKEEIFVALIRVCFVELKNAGAENLRKRILRHGEELFTFLDYPEIEPDNNRAERQLRPNVILRKITFGHRSSQGLRNHSVIMSLIETAKLNGVTPRDILLSLLTNGDTKSIAQALFGSIQPRAP